MPRYCKNGTPLTWWRRRLGSLRGETGVPLSRLHAEEVLSKGLSFIERGIPSIFAMITVTIRTDMVAQFLLRAVPKTIEISATHVKPSEDPHI
jgi:hypothetical protein